MWNCMEPTISSKDRWWWWWWYLSLKWWWVLSNIIINYKLLRVGCTIILHVMDLHKFVLVLLECTVMVTMVLMFDYQSDTNTWQSGDNGDDDDVNSSFSSYIKFPQKGGL